MNEQQVLSYILKQIGITPNSLPSNEKEAWSSGKYNASGDAVPKDETGRFEVLYDKQGNNPEPSPINKGLLSMMPTSSGDLALETIATGIGESTGNGVAGVLAGTIAGLGKSAIKNIFNPKTKKIESYYTYTPKKEYYDEGLSKNKIQEIYNPETKKIEKITTEEFQQILKETDGIDAPFLKDQNPNPAFDKDNLEGFGNLNWRIGRLPSDNVPLQYGNINIPMADLDYPDASHKGGPLQTTVGNLGDILEKVNKYVGDNRIERNLNLQLTPGGGRIFDQSFLGNMKNRGISGLLERISFLDELDADPFYKHFEAGRLKNSIKTVAKREGYNPSIIPMKFTQDLFRGNVPKEISDAIYTKLGRLKSAIRLDPKPERLKRMLGEDTSAPFTAQSLLDVGNPNLKDKYAINSITMQNQLIDKLRRARGASDPDRPDLGFGFLETLEKQLKTVSPKDASKIRENLLLGGVPIAELLQEEE